MPMNDTTQLSNSQYAMFDKMYADQVWYSRAYDRFAEDVGPDMRRFIQGTQIIFPFISKMNIGTATMSEENDVIPQALLDAQIAKTPTSRGEVLQQSELMKIRAWTDDFESTIFELIGENAAESIDLVAQNAALQGNVVVRAAARASLDAGTAGNRLTDAEFDKAGNMLLEFKVPRFVGAGEVYDPAGDYFAMCHADSFYDLRTGGNIVSIAQYQNQGIIMNNELGYKAPFRIVCSPWAKVFGGAGADNGTAVATTLSAAANKLATTIVVASATNITVGRYITIGTEETGSTHYETNERVRVVSASGTTVTIHGAGANGGLRHNHASGVAVRNADSVYPVVFGSAGSLKRWYDPNTGPYGKIVGPKVTGNLDQWESVGWKWYGNYARLVESHIIRGEYSSSLDA